MIHAAEAENIEAFRVQLKHQGEQILSRIKDHPSSANTHDGQNKRVVWTDGFCPQCSEYCRPLTLKLAELGVPTGAKNWPSKWGLEKLIELGNFHYALNRLVIAVEDGNHEKINRAVRDVTFYRELHGRRYRAMAVEHQKQAVLSSHRRKQGTPPVTQPPEFPVPSTEKQEEK